MPAPNELKKYLAGVAAPASLLAHRARGCNDIYHLKFFFCTSILSVVCLFVKEGFISNIVLEALLTDFPA